MRGNSITDRNGNKNPNYKGGRKGTRLYRIYNNIKTRCYNKNSPSYLYYGNKGVTMCNDWLNDYNMFYNWSMSNGYKDGLTIDRIDFNGDYEPNNCRWVSYTEQARNTSTNKIIKLGDEEHCLIEWCEIYNINYHTVQDRLRRGWSIENALLVTVDTRFRRKVVNYEV